MFTGLITDIGTLTDVRSSSQGRSFRIQTTYDPTSLELGESIACNGACLTVTSVEHDTFWVDASPETLSRTTLGTLHRGARLHLERALRVSDRLGGHLVSGHVDAVGRLAARSQMGNAIRLRVEAPLRLAPFLVEKGSVALDGVSLTVNQVEDRSDALFFEVAIIPFTGTKTLLSNRQVDSPINLEVDSVARILHRFYLLQRSGFAFEDPQSATSAASSTVTMEHLKDAGWL